MKAEADPLKAARLPRFSTTALKLFASFSRRHLSQRFHSLRVLNSALPPSILDRPLVIFINHSSWWDPLVCLLLAREFFPQRHSFAPMDAAMLERYAFFRRLGFFGVEPGTARGARVLLRTADAILASPRGALWLTPQGRFSDPRERPLRLEGGLSALAARHPRAAFVPLAIEYPFWTEPRPEALCAFGEPVIPEDAPDRARPAWTPFLTDALETVQDELAAHSCRREAADWRLLNRGKSGVTGIYDAWRWFRARLRGEQLVLEHQPEGSR